MKRIVSSDIFTTPQSDSRSSVMEEQMAMFSSDQVDNRTGEKLIFRRSGMALPPALGQDTDSDAGSVSCLLRKNETLQRNSVIPHKQIEKQLKFSSGNVADSDSLASFLSGHMQDNELEVHKFVSHFLLLNEQFPTRRCQVSGDLTWTRCPSSARVL